MKIVILFIAENVNVASSKWMSKEHNILFIIFTYEKFPHKRLKKGLSTQCMVTSLLLTLYVEIMTVNHLNALHACRYLSLSSACFSASVRATDVSASFDSAASRSSSSCWSCFVKEATSSSALGNRLKIDVLSMCAGK